MTAYPPCPWKSKSTRIAPPCAPFGSGCTDTSTPSAGAVVHCVTESKESNTIVEAGIWVAAATGVAGTTVGIGVGAGGFDGGAVGFCAAAFAATTTENSHSMDLQFIQNLQSFITPVCKLGAKKLTKLKAPRFSFVDVNACQDLRPALTKLSLHRSRHDSLYVVPLQEQEDRQNWNHRQHRSRHHQLCVLHVLTRQIRQRHRQRVVRFVAQHDQRPHEIVPR